MENTTAKISAKEVRKALLGGHYAILSAYRDAYSPKQNAERTQFLVDALGNALYKCAVGETINEDGVEECVFILDIPQKELLAFTSIVDQDTVIHNGTVLNPSKGWAVSGSTAHIYNTPAEVPAGKTYKDVCGVLFTLDFLKKSVDRGQ